MSEEKGLVEKKKKGRGNAKELTHKERSKILTLRAANVPIRDIATVMNRSKRSIEVVLNKYKKLFEVIESGKDYRTFRADVLSGGELQLLKSVLDEQAIASAPLNHRATAFREVSHQHNLAAGKATQNVAVKVQFAEPRLEEVEEDVDPET